MVDILIVLIIGAVAGWLVGMMRHVELVPGLIFGMIGGFLGHFVFGMFKITFGSGLPNTLLTSALGAIVVVLVFSFVKKHA